MKKNNIPQSVVKSSYFAYWSDLWGFPVAKFFLPLFASIPFITPNAVTIGSFVLHIIACLSLFIVYPNHLIVAGILFIVSFIGDDLDGQLARYTQRSSIIGDYLDKVLDLLKIYTLLLSLSYALYISEKSIIPIIAGFTACFFYTFRMYLKYVTMYIAFDRDPLYFKKSSEMRQEMLKDLKKKHEELNKSLFGKTKIFLAYNRAIFFLDETEIAVFTGLAAFFNRLDIALWIFVISQILISIFKFFERLIHIKNNSVNLLKPMRK